MNYHVQVTFIMQTERKTITCQYYEGYNKDEEQNTYDEMRLLDLLKKFILQF